MNKISVLLGQGSGGIGNGPFAAAVVLTTGSGPFELVSADFNGDGIPRPRHRSTERRRCASCRGSVPPAPATGPSVLSSTFPIANLGTGIATGDFNHDGIPDLVATEYNNGKVGVLLGTGTPVIGAASFSIACPLRRRRAAAYHIEIADFNEDNSPDLMVANTSLVAAWSCCSAPATGASPFRPRSHPATPRALRPAT